jgi:hypothetical protein
MRIIIAVTEFFGAFLYKFFIFQDHGQQAPIGFNPGFTPTAKARVRPA